jgi:hypothetical protein
MIKNIFWDIDETLIHTETRSFGRGYNDVKFELDGFPYYTVIRPCSNSLIEFSREMVGKDNVYILTTATTDYAREINRIAGWNFEHDHIIAREDISNHKYTLPYGGKSISRHKVADVNNVLIDNLPIRDNYDKVDLIGIVDRDRYFKIRDYYGVNFPNDSFDSDVREFLTQKNNEKPPNNPSNVDDDVDG